MIWGSIGRFGTGPLTVIQKKLTGEGYKRILSQKLRYIEHKAGRLWIFQHDNACVHTAKVVCKYLQKRKVAVAPWPPSSPDLSPIENLCPVLKKKVEVYKPRTKPQLIWAIH